MDTRDYVEKFLTGPFKEMEIPTDNPESSRVIWWRYLKARREALKDFTERVSISKREKSIVLKKYKEIGKECILTLNDGSKVSFEDAFREPSEDVKKYNQEMRDYKHGILPEWQANDFEMPTEEKIKSWNMTKVDEEYTLKTLRELDEEERRKARNKVKN